jgi:hypothetical protein
MEMAQLQPFGFTHPNQDTSLTPNNLIFSPNTRIESVSQAVGQSGQNFRLRSSTNEMRPLFVSHFITNDQLAQRVNHHSPVPSETNTVRIAKPRAILTKDKAIAIYQQKLPRTAKDRPPSATALARQYGVSEKTIRDIWTGRTWSLETAAMDPTRPLKPPAAPGRPKGRRDRIPRKRRAAHRVSAPLSGPGDAQSASPETTDCVAGSDSDAQPRPAVLPSRDASVNTQCDAARQERLEDAGSGQPPDPDNPISDDWIEWPRGPQNWTGRPAQSRSPSCAPPPADAPTRLARPPKRRLPSAAETAAAPWPCAVAGGRPPDYADVALQGGRGSAVGTAHSAAAPWYYSAAGPGRQPAPASGHFYAGPGPATWTGWDRPSAAQRPSCTAAAPPAAVAAAAGGAWREAQWPAGNGRGEPSAAAGGPGAFQVWPAWSGGHAAQAEPPPPAAAGSDPRIPSSAWAGRDRWSGQSRPHPGPGPAGEVPAAAYDGGGGCGGGGVKWPRDSDPAFVGPGESPWAMGGGPQAVWAGWAAAGAGGRAGAGAEADGRAASSVVAGADASAGGWAGDADVGGVGAGAGGWAGAGAGVGGWAGAGMGAGGWAGAGVGAGGWAGAGAGAGAGGWAGAGAGATWGALGGAAPAHFVPGDACGPCPGVAPGAGGGRARG